MSTAFTIEVSKTKTRNALAVWQERKQTLPNSRRNKRPKDARKSWKREEW